MTAAATTTPTISVDEYLRTSYKPACEYIGGVLRQKSMPASDHADVQLRVAVLVNQRAPTYLASPDLTVRVRSDKYMVPDVAVRKRAGRETPYPTRPVALCVEVMSPDDRFAQVVAKCDEYLDWGVPTAWILDPLTRKAWQYDEWPPVEVPTGGSLTAGDISISLDEIFEILDE